MVYSVLGFILSMKPLLARENYAILVGVSRYENLAERYWLEGPANDVKLAFHYLTTTANPPFDEGNIAVLADGVEGASSPTLAGIRAAFDAVAEQVQEGDFVYIHLAGHGSQAPAVRPDQELDGLDEVFLPIDVGAWNNTVGHIENGLIDDEIGEMLDALTARGADVWIVFDSCHSGTATRAAPVNGDDTRLRKIPQGALGVPDQSGSDFSLAARSRKALLSEPATAQTQGELTAFFAAQTNETTPEKHLPSGQPKARSHGVFTYVLFETMSQNPGISYRQLGQEILRQYSVKSLTRSTPMFSGALDQRLFSGDPQERVFQWPVTPTGSGYSIPAGSVQGLEVGDKLVLLKNASDGPDQAIGSFRVTKADLLQSEVARVGQFDVPAGALLRAESSKLHLGLKVALPEKSGNDALDAILTDAVRALVTKHATC